MTCLKDVAIAPGGRGNASGYPTRHEADRVELQDGQELLQQNTNFYCCRMETRRDVSAMALMSRSPAMEGNPARGGVVFLRFLCISDLLCILHIAGRALVRL